MKDKYIVHMSDLQSCSHDDLVKFIEKAKNEIKAIDGVVDYFLIHGDSMGVVPNKKNTKEAVKAAGPLPSPELRWVAALIGGDSLPPKYPQSGKIDYNSSKVKELADIITDGNKITQQRYNLMLEYAQNPIVVLRGNGEPTYSWWAQIGLNDLIESGKIEPVENLITRIANENDSLTYLKNSVVSTIDYQNKSSSIIIPWTGTDLITLLANYSGVENAQDLINNEKENENGVFYNLIKSGVFNPEVLKDQRRLTINMHGAPTIKHSDFSLKYEGKKGKKIEQENLVNYMLNQVSQYAPNLEFRFIHGHDGVEIHQDHTIRQNGQNIRAVHIVEEGPATYENLRTGDIILSSDAKKYHDRTLENFEANIQRK